MQKSRVRLSSSRCYAPEEVEMNIEVVEVASSLKYLSSCFSEEEGPQEHVEMKTI